MIFLMSSTDFVQITPENSKVTYNYNQDPYYVKCAYYFLKRHFRTNTKVNSYSKITFWLSLSSKLKVPASRLSLLQ